MTPSVHLRTSSSNFVRRRRLFFGAPIETSISPIRGEMPVLRRLTGGILTSFTADYEKSIARVARTHTCIGCACRAAQFVIILPDVREYATASVQAIMSHFGPDITFQFDIAGARTRPATLTTRRIYQAFLQPAN